MKKLFVLMAALSLFAVACATNTTIDASSAETEPGSQSESPTTAPAPQNDGDGAEPTEADETDDAPDPTATPVDEDPTPAPEEEPTPAAPEEEPTSAPAEPAPEALAAVQAVADADNWCEAAAAVEDGTGALDELNFTDPAELEQGMTLSLAAVSASKRLAPSEIAADVDQSIEAFSTLVAALEDVDWVFLELDLSIIEQFDGPMELATYNIEAYNFTECGIGEDPGLPPVIADDGTVEGSLDDLPDLDGSIRDQTILGLVAAGFGEDEAGCIVDNLDFANPEVMADVNALLEVFTGCGISLDRLAQLGGG